MSTTPPATGRPVDGRYTVLRHLADGGMASVYVARDERLDREVALKVMRPDLASDPEFVERFRSEAQSAARLRSPHAVAVYDQGRDGDVVFLAMELVPGMTLRARLDEAGALTAKESLEVMDSVLAALAEAHAIGIVHRDVKPENVLIRDDGAVKVADFGLARAVTTRTNTALGRGLLGTFAYVAPEQVSDGHADARSDVYAAGLVLSEMLTGSQVFTGESPIHVAFRHVNESVPPPSSIDPGLADELDECVLAATALDPDERPENAERYRTLLRGLRSQLTDAQLDREPPAAVDHTPPSAPVNDARTQVIGSDLLRNRTRLLTGVGASAAGATDAEDAAAPPARPEGSSAGGSGGTPRRKRRGLLATGLLGALLAGLLAWFMLAGPGAVRALPPVTGQPVAEATAALDAAGFDASVTEQFSEDIPVGQVISTDPAEGQARAWRPVQLTVSKGPERYAVPEVAGLDPASATAAVEGAQLAVMRTTESWSEDVPAGQVASTDPAIGTPLPPGGAVTLHVSKGPEPIAVKDWRGSPIAEATDSLEKSGLTVTVTGSEHSDSVPKGRVLSQQPVDTTLHRGDEVTLVESLGPRMVEVPTVQGMQENEAVTALKDTGFEVRVERIVGGVFGTARSTDPEAGTNAPRGSTITLYVV